jgi:hypothetical protein
VWTLVLSGGRSPDSAGPASDRPLNPAGYVWSNLRRSPANLTKQGTGQLAALVKTWLKRMQDRPGLIDSFLAETGLGHGFGHTPFGN